jgi:hypothetical protein
MNDPAINARARELWNAAGLLSAGVQFATFFESDYETGKMLIRLMVDVPKVGKQNSMTVRCHRAILVEQANDENLKAVIDLLYADMIASVAHAAGIGVKL